MHTNSCLYTVTSEKKKPMFFKRTRVKGKIFYFPQLNILKGTAYKMRSITLYSNLLRVAQWITTCH